MSRRLTALLALPAIHLLAACSTPTGVTTSGALDAFKPIRAHASDTCETQIQVAEHNSRYDTLKEGKPVVYKAACQMPQRVARKSS